MRLIYREKCQVLFYNLPGGGACNVICIPLDADSMDQADTTGGI